MLLHQFHSLTPLRLEGSRPGDGDRNPLPHSRLLQELAVSDLSQMDHPEPRPQPELRQRKVHSHTHRMGLIWSDR